MFPDLKRDRETASPECRYWAGTGKRMFPNARDREFPEFFGKYPIPGKWHSGTQTSSLVRNIYTLAIMIYPKKISPLVLRKETSKFCNSLLLYCYVFMMPGVMKVFWTVLDWDWDPYPTSHMKTYQQTVVSIDLWYYLLMYTTLA